MSRRSLFSSSRASSKRRRCCTLMITRRCNLNCSYCYESHKSHDVSHDMTFETAKRLLLAEFSLVKASRDFDEIEIDFMGGEPLMNFDLIKKVVEWIEKILHRYHIFVLRQQMQHWLKNIKIGFSNTGKVLCWEVVLMERMKCRRQTEVLVMSCRRTLRF